MSRTDNLADSWGLTLYHHQNARGNLDLALLSPSMRTHLYYYSKYPIMISSDTTITNTAAVCFPSQAISIWTIVSYPLPVSILQIVFLTSTCITNNWIKLEDEVVEMAVPKSTQARITGKMTSIRHLYTCFSLLSFPLQTEAGWACEAGGYVNKWAGLYSIVWIVMQMTRVIVLFHMSNHIIIPSTLEYPCMMKPWPDPWV